MHKYSLLFSVGVNRRPQYTTSHLLFLSLFDGVKNNTPSKKGGVTHTVYRSVSSPKLIWSA